ncbi:PQQ-binding-like beta-propeller repeat protein [Thermococcus celer]|uniref:WD40 repeat domain-containing protein n=1 Tax=Thermococcus celer Vu 13 = JCM 8558 TaxID=1293037 RepID=A0A218P0N2_THECE|nr:PQQ-binding-like beta-propeller repeat protein [Thermococcus celer]ASI98491.1 hypothetical protein A3L02_02370 [Thermococcus celer Vu 13 = JCM 8558]
MKRLFPLILLLLTLTPVSAQPHLLWTYHDQCIVFSMAFNDRGDLALAFGYNAVLLRPNGSVAFRAPVRGLAYSVAASDNGTVIVGTDGYWVQFFDSHGKLLREYRTENVVYSVDISPDGKYAVASNVGGFVYFFRDTALVWKRDVGSYVWSVDLVGDRILVGADDGKLVAFSLDGRALLNITLPGDVKRVAGNDDMFVSLAVSPDETWSSVYAFTWDGKELWEKKFDGLIRDMDFDGKRIALGGGLNEIVLLDGDGKQVYSVPFYLMTTDVATANGYTLAAGEAEAIIIGPDGAIMADYPSNDTTIDKVAISPGARYLALTRRFHGKELCEADVDFMGLNETSPVTPTESTTATPPKRELGNPAVALGIGALVLIAIAMLWREMRE